LLLLKTVSVVTTKGVLKICRFTGGILKRLWLAGDKIVGDITIVRKKENHRLMEVKMNHSVEGHSKVAEHAPQRSSFYHIE